MLIPPGPYTLKCENLPDASFHALHGVKRAIMKQQRLGATGECKVYDVRGRLIMSHDGRVFTEFKRPKPVPQLDGPLSAMFQF